MGMFDFLLAAPYADRVVARWDSDVNEDISVSTAKVVDGLQPIETAVMHPHYNEGKWMIVEAYSTVEQAREGHRKWVQMVETDTLPAVIQDCCNAEVASFGSMLAGDDQEAAGLVYRRTVNV